MPPTLPPPFSVPFYDEKSKSISALWQRFFLSFFDVVSGDVAPADADYILGSADPELPNAILLSNVHRRGTLAARPVATAVPAGTLYYTTDTEYPLTFRSTGLAWESYSTGVDAAGLATIALTGTILSRVAFLQGAAPSTAGGLRLSNTHGVFSRNAANSGDVGMMVLSAANNIVIGDALGIANDIAFQTNSAIHWRVTSAGNWKAEAGTQLIQWGATAAFPMLKRSSAVLQVRLADDSAFADLTCANLTADNVLSGVYTPGLTNVANLDASTAFQCQYMRVGSVVTVSGKVDVDPTTPATLTQLGIALPIASNFGAVEDCGGTAFASAIAGQGAAIQADAANNRAEMVWIAGDVTNQPMFFSFTYRIV